MIRSICLPLMFATTEQLNNESMYSIPQSLSKTLGRFLQVSCILNVFSTAITGHRRVVKKVADSLAL